MAVQAISVVNDITTDFPNKVRAEGEGPGGTPYGSRIGVLAGYMGEHLQTKVGTFTVDAVGAAAGVEVELGFIPRYMVAVNLTTLARYEKFSTQTLAKAFKQVAAGTLSEDLASFAFAKIDTTAFKGFSLAIASATLADVWHFMAVGL